MRLLSIPRVAALTLAVGLIGGPSTLTVAADPSPSPGGATTRWSGPALPTTPMSAADAAAIDALAAAALAQTPDLPGMWIGVWDPAKGVYLQAYGEAVKGGAKATVGDHGRIGSVTKTFTITAVLEQVAAGKLRLESTIADVLPDLATRHPAIAAITVEQLAGMRSGIADYANTGVVLREIVTDPAKVWTADALIDAALTLPLAAPGTGGYSTTNTIILGQMLEKLTGTPIHEIVTDVARRAGLSQSALQAPDVTAMPEPASHGYVMAAGAKELAGIGGTVAPGTDVSGWTTSWGQAGGGMYATIADLGTWAGTGLGSSLLPPDLVARRLTTAKIPEGAYGLGILDWGNGWIGHTGQLIGWESVVAYNTKTGAAFVAIVNDTSGILTAEAVGIQAFPDLVGLVGLGQ
ncbi:MAG: serine hydrolase domain-containing protein [Chloroflexota bacterium]